MNANPLLGITTGTRLEIEPAVNKCEASGMGGLWVATVAGSSNGMYGLVFDNKTCPPEKTNTGVLLQYWLKPDMNTWKIYPGILSSSQFQLTLLQNQAIDVRTINTRDRATGNLVPIFAVGMLMGAPPMPLQGDTTSIPVSVKTVMTDKDIQKRKKDIQDMLLNKYKPRLVRNIAGARGEGIGIRDPGDTEFRKDWLSIPKDSFVSAELLVTDADGQPVSTIVVHGKVSDKFEQSHLLNGLGMVYQMEPDASVGDPVDVETYAPVYIGRRRLRYFLGVFYDLLDSKVVISSSTVSHQELVDNVAGGGNGTLRLAEYLLSDLKLSTEDQNSVPFKGDLEDKKLQDLLKQAKILSMPIPAQTSSNADMANAVPRLVEAPIAPPQRKSKFDPSVADTGLAGGQKASGLGMNPPSTRSGVGGMGMIHLPGGGLEVPDFVKALRA